MKIMDVEVFPLTQRQEDPTWTMALAKYPVIEGWIVAVHSEGRAGYGYAQSIPHMGSSRESLAGALALFRPRLIGRSALGIDPIMADLDAVISGNNQAKAAIDCALHDLQARANAQTNLAAAQAMQQAKTDLFTLFNKPKTPRRA